MARTNIITTVIFTFFVTVSFVHCLEHPIQIGNKFPLGVQLGDADGLEDGYDGACETDANQGTLQFSSSTNSIRVCEQAGQWSPPLGKGTLSSGGSLLRVIHDSSATVDSLVPEGNSWRAVVQWGASKYDSRVANVSGSGITFNYAGILSVQLNVVATVCSGDATTLRIRSNGMGSVDETEFLVRGTAGSRTDSFATTVFVEPNTTLYVDAMSCNSIPFDQVDGAVVMSILWSPINLGSNVDLRLGNPARADLGCDFFSQSPSLYADDGDGDMIGLLCDNCPAHQNTDQADADGDNVGNPCDNCPQLSNTDQSDSDSDGKGDVCDSCPLDPQNDIDGDGYCEDEDNCPESYNIVQLDSDTDGLGDACDACPLDANNDIDEDSVCGDVDNCEDVSNPGQEDLDSDGIGDTCDGDADGDNVQDDVDNCLRLYNPDQEDADSDGLGNSCDSCPFDDENDIDSDGVCGDEDNCPSVPNAGQEDTDEDEIGNACDNCPNTNNADQPDNDSDGAGNACDNCINVENVGQEDTDQDGLGNACDSCPTDPTNDVDNDGICGQSDNCPMSPNTDQSDVDSDGDGDVCDVCPFTASYDGEWEYAGTLDDLAQIVNVYPATEYEYGVQFESGHNQVQRVLVNSWNVGIRVSIVSSHISNSNGFQFDKIVFTQGLHDHPDGAWRAFRYTYSTSVNYLVSSFISSAGTTPFFVRRRDTAWEIVGLLADLPTHLTTHPQEEYEYGISYNGILGKAIPRRVSISYWDQGLRVGIDEMYPQGDYDWSLRWGTTVFTKGLIGTASPDNWYQHYYQGFPYPTIAQVSNGVANSLPLFRRKLTNSWTNVGGIGSIDSYLLTYPPTNYEYAVLYNGYVSPVHVATEGGATYVHTTRPYPMGNYHDSLVWGTTTFTRNLDYQDGNFYHQYYSGTPPQRMWSNGAFNGPFYVRRLNSAWSHVGTLQNMPSISATYASTGNAWAISGQNNVVFPEEVAVSSAGSSEMYLRKPYRLAGTTYENLIFTMNFVSHNGGGRYFQYQEYSYYHWLNGYPTFWPIVVQDEGSRPVFARHQCGDAH